MSSRPYFCRYNSETFEGKLYSWIPYLRAPRKCELNCMPQGERFYYRHAKKASSELKFLFAEHNSQTFTQVIDGTTCDLNDDVPRVCVDGECVAVGCDGELGGDKREDKCRREIGG